REPSTSQAMPARRWIAVAVRGGSRWKPYEDPDGRFTVSVPDGWWVSPPVADGDDRYGAVATFPVRPFTNVCQAPFPVSLVGMRDGDVAIAIGPATNGGAPPSPPAPNGLHRPEVADHVVR
ncbi:MAG: hypothetical protein ACXVP3_04505, partial [Actinomycetota bacterium]